MLLAKPEQPNWALSENKAKDAAAGWGGDAYTVYYQAELDESILVSLSAWDSEKEANEFWDAFMLYGDQRWGSNYEVQQNQRIWQVEDQVILIEKIKSGRLGDCAGYGNIGIDQIGNHGFVGNNGY